MDNNVSTRGARIMVNLGRAAVVLGLIALLSAWVSQLTGGPLLGLSQQHLFNDAIILMLADIAFFIDAHWHARHL